MKLQLEYVHLVHRHGERTPLMFGPHNTTKWNMCHRVSQIDYTIPKKHPTLFDKIKGVLSYMHMGTARPLRFKIVQNSGRQFNCAPGQLTDTGRANLFGLGEWFRKKYVEDKGLISPHFNNKEFNLRSTNFQRTLESLQSLMQGMYKNSSGPMDVTVVDLTQDSLTSNKHCPRLKALKDASHQSIKKMFEPESNKIRDYFTKNHSKFFASLSPYAIYDLIVSSRAHGFTEFLRVPKSIMSSLENYSVQLWFNHLNTKEALSLNTGNLLKEIADQMVIKCTDTASDLKASIFSAHDITVYPLLMAVGINNMKWPKFGANIVFELFKDANSQKRYVQMRYNGQKIEMPRCHPIKIEKGIYCPLDDFVRMCNETYTENFSQACMKEQ
ncbi:lysophosphatidic acid phosphatase type 6 [Nematocida sp. AWRm78]|nr:lysophosphatidic acid phosphatase type 6 [Nematocida sp. AWRm79]KAI5184199.1 lysophosphatidic acid phosphatase type 6 [Nematocida sp. AWRm78]